MNCRRQRDLSGASGRRLGGGDAAARAVAEFRGAVNPVNARVSGSFFREVIRLPSVPIGLASVWFAHWNGPATQLYNEHRPLILMQAHELRDFIVREMTDRKAVASNGSGGEREGLPGVPHVV